MDVIVTKRRNGLQRLRFQTLDDCCRLQSIFGLMVGIGIRAAPPRCSIVGVAMKESRVTIGMSETLIIVKFTDAQAMDQIVFEYCAPGLRIAVKFRRAVGMTEAAPLLEERGIGCVVPHVPNDTYPFDPFLKTSVHGRLCRISKIMFEDGCSIELVDDEGKMNVVTIHELKNLVDNNI